MKNSKRTLSFLTLAFLAVIGLTACTPQPKDLTEQMKTYETAWKEAYNNGDAHALAMLYTADAKLYPDNSNVIEGRDAIEAFWNSALTMGMARAEPTTVSATAVGNMMIHEGEYKSFTKDDQLIDRGKYLLTRQKEEGDWKIDKHIWNSSIPELPVKGAWKLMEYKNITDGSVAYSFPGSFEMGQIKIWTDNHFCFSGTYTINNETTDNYGGGTFTLDGGNIYSENIEFHTSKPMIGTSVKMLIEVKGNTLTQTYPVDDSGNFDENNYSVEKYVRLD